MCAVALPVEWRRLRQRIELTLGPAIVYRQLLALNEACVFEARAKAEQSSRMPCIGADHESPGSKMDQGLRTWPISARVNKPERGEGGAARRSSYGLFERFVEETSYAETCTGS